MSSVALEYTRTPLFCDDSYLIRYCKASASKRPSVPGGIHFKRMEDFLRNHSTMGYKGHYLEYIADSCCHQPDYVCEIASHRKGRCFAPGVQSPTPIPMPIPCACATFVTMEDLEAEDVQCWSGYMALKDIPEDWKTRFHLDKDVNRFNPQAV